MNIGSICKRRVISIDQTDTMRHAAALMREHHVGALAVTAMTPAGACVRGIVTDRDLAMEVMAAGAAGSSARVGELVRGDAVTALESVDIPRAFEVMQAADARCLLVKNHDNRLVGIVEIAELQYASETNVHVRAWAARSSRWHGTPGMEATAAAPELLPISSALNSDRR